jgi:prolipoprotein diacylglyceryltransferase
MVVATIVGARLGHIIFYQPEIIWQEPLSIFLPFEFSPFRFTGLQGLASHGGAIGILFALWLYSRKKKPGQSYLQVVDRIVILVALTGALIRLGNFFNSEIIGLPTDKPYGVVFVSRLAESITDKRYDRDGIVESVDFKGNDSLPAGSNGRIPLNIYVFFKPGTARATAETFTNFTIRNLLANTLYEHFDATGENTRVDFSEQEGEPLAARITTFGISRHPAQLYESVSCVALFVVLLLMWANQKNDLPAGRLLGVFLIWCFGLRFLFEFLKENQESFEDNMVLNMGQVLSIPLVIAGVVILLLSYRKETEAKP